MNTESSSMQEFLEQIRRDAPDNLVIHNPGSNILQLYELNTPFMILLETCHEKDNFFSIYQITPGNTYSSQSTYSQYKALSKRPLHQHSCYEIMFVLSGSITNHVENQTFTYGPGQCCVMNKNIKHCEIVAGDFQVVFFMIQDVFLEQLLEEYEEVSEHKTEAPGMNPIFQLYLDSLHKTSRFHKVYLDYLPVIPADSILEQLNPLFNFMLEEIRKNSPGSLFFLKGTFARFLQILDTPSLYCIARVQSDSSSQEYIFSKICHIMEASRGRSSRDYLEKQLHYNGEYLNRIVKKYTGKTISEYGQDFCLAEAGRLLTKTDMSVSAIITELGYSNRSYFYRIFQNAFNETPLEYRKKHKDTSVS